ncbi:hypothetical protein V5F01_05780 [Streptomyces sp. NRRL B-2790]|uniref:hypothetical protein n=2 Tax=unclassified Streptomyces TaxID=2593676 RepID=UPI003567F4CB
MQAYATQCMADPLHAQDVTSHVFAGLLQQMLAGESHIERRHPGCLRPHLLGNVRTTAIASWHREPETLAPDFRDWIAAGSRWPWSDDGQLALAFERLPVTTQLLLWHSLVDRDPPALMARITGLAHPEVPTACDQARSALRQARTDLYLERLERLERRDCWDAVRHLSVRPEAPLDGQAAAHLRACPACVSVYKDVTRLDSQLEAQLPVRLLGWWTGEYYLRAKAAIPVPLGEPPFMAGLLDRGRMHVPAEPPDTLRAVAAGFPQHRRGARWTSFVQRRIRKSAPTEAPPDGPPAAETRNSGRHSRKKGALVPRRSGAAAVLGGFLAGIGVGMLLLTGCEGNDGQRPPSGPASAPSQDRDGSPAQHVSGGAGGLLR